MSGRPIPSAMRRAAAAGLSALAVLAAPILAHAGQPVALRLSLSSGPQITLGDLFEGAGAGESVMVGYGAPPGQTAGLDAAAVQRMARLHGLDWDNTDGIRFIMVRGGRSTEASAPRTVDALTYARTLRAGEIIQPADLDYAKVAAFAVPPDAPRDAQGVIGMMAARPLRGGAPVAAHDLAAAQVIKRDDIVQVTYSADGVNLVLQAKAMAPASVGQPLSVMNTASNKVIQAVAVGPGQAVVGPDAERLRGESAAPAAQYASQYAALR